MNKEIIENEKIEITIGDFNNCLDNVKNEAYLEGVKDATSEREEKKRVIEVQENIKNFRDHLISKYGNFYFNFYNRIIDEIPDQYLIRFIYLCTYMNYDNILVAKKGTKDFPILELKLGDILRLGKTETYKTYNFLIEKEYLIHNGNNIIVNKLYSKKGDIPVNKNVKKVRMFNDAIREIYITSKPREHKKLALLIRLLPYINFRWNMICKNPSEENKELIEPYDLKLLANIMEQKNITRFKKNLLDLEVNNEKVVCMHIIGDKTLIAVNPRIYYKGNRREELDYLDLIFNNKIV